MEKLFSKFVIVLSWFVVVFSLIIVLDMTVFASLYEGDQEVSPDFVIMSALASLIFAFAATRYFSKP
jgi:hypothetical protein